jgi:hypothetical protein
MSARTISCLVAGALLAVTVAAPGARADLARARANPKALCEAARSAGFGGPDLYWGADAQNRDRYFCFGGIHDFPGGWGNVIMYSFEVSGAAARADHIVVTVETHTDRLPKDRIGKALELLLGRLFATAGTPDVPGDVKAAIYSLSPIAKASTPLGHLAAAYADGSNPSSPYNGARYRVRIYLDGSF